MSLLLFSVYSCSVSAEKAKVAGQDCAGLRLGTSNVGYPPTQDLVCSRCHVSPRQRDRSGSERVSGEVVVHAASGGELSHLVLQWMSDDRVDTMDILQKQVWRLEAQMERGGRWVLPPANLELAMVSVCNFVLQPWQSAWIYKHFKIYKSVTVLDEKNIINGPIEAFVCFQERTRTTRSASSSRSIWLSRKRIVFVVNCDRWSSGTGLTASCNIRTR